MGVIIPNNLYALSEAREEAREEEIIRIARNLLDVLDNETIALKTGLSIEKVKKLREENIKS